MTNLEVLNINKMLSAGDVLRKKLPVSVLFALHSNIKIMNSAADIFVSTRDALLEAHGCTADAASPEVQEEIVKLVHEDADIDDDRLKKVPVSAFDQCDGEKYDALSYADLDALSFMLEG